MKNDSVLLMCKRYTGARLFENHMKGAIDTVKQELPSGIALLLYCLRRTGYIMRNIWQTSEKWKVGVIATLHKWSVGAVFQVPQRENRASLKVRLSSDEYAMRGIWSMKPSEFAEWQLVFAFHGAGIAESVRRGL
jgi:hypothetical protein